MESTAVRHGLDGVVWASVIVGLVSLVVFAYLRQRSVRSSFER